MLTFFPPPIVEQDAFFTPAQLLFTNTANMPRIAVLLYRRLACWVVIAFVQTKMLRLCFRYFRSFHHNGFNRFVQQLRIVNICPRDNNRKRPAQPIRQKALFRAVFASICRVGSNFIASRTSLAQRAIRGLPFPIHQPQFFTFLQQQCPKLGKQIDFHPMLERSMNCRIIAIHAWNVIPLTPRAHPKNQGIQNIARMDARSARFFGWVKFQDERFHALP